MVKAIVDISKDANQVFNIIKAKHGFKDKSEAINFVAIEYGEEILEPELRPEFIEKMLEIRKEKPVHVGTADNLREMIGIK